ncbi:diacylglycerol kinase family lipid kinase [Irregularibacter muris]|uniref:Diacylglycerol kinase family lipid kinase n=1 Tax=Irregularibacter muris TaxID=1796619 RepID=A0AAE3HFM7_9FIRM|nr:diacylglycerol kinase family protein [Irregularibacter muris]MCR1899261.1 diacylglycerol kinase family lipid kinase [Irregularibacter muris]
MKVYFIVNPIAGKGKGKEFMEQAIHFMRDRNVQWEIAYTQYPGHAIELASQVDDNLYSKVVSVGGDGTIYEIINGLKDKSISLGIIPAGTGNDLARSVHIPLDKQEALRVIFDGNEKQMDIGNMEEHRFVNVAGVGLDVEVLRCTEFFKKFVKGSIAYVLGLLKALFTFKAIELNISIDGVMHHEEVMLCAIANGQYYGGGMKIAPTADVGDGYFDIYLITKLSKLKLLFLFPRVFKGSHIDLPWVKTFRGKKVTITSKEEIWVNADGEISKKHSPTFEIIEKGLKVSVAQEMSLMAQPADQ